MSLIVYEFQRAEHGHEIRQFNAAAQSLYNYFEGRDEIAIFIGNLNVGDANLDGLIVKNDAIIIVEFKDYSGRLEARQNGDWTCDGKPIKGGNGGKSVFEQLKKNRSILRKTIAEQDYFSEAQRSDIKGLVVLTKLTGYSDDFDRTNKAWIYVSDVENMGKRMHDIESQDFKDWKTGRSISSHISDDDLWLFLRKLKIDEKSMVTDFSDTTILPEDLYHKESPHNGKYRSTATELAHSREEVAKLNQQVEELLSQMESLKVVHQKEVNEKNSEIINQKAQILQIMSDKLTSDKESAKAQTEIEKLQKQLAQLRSSMQKMKDSENKQNSKDLSNDEEKQSVQTLAVVNNKEEGKQKKIKKKRFGLKERVLKEFNVAETSMDAEQIGLIDRTLDHPMIISGCAGSGKSVIAMCKAQQIMDDGGDVILITYTKSLDRYMKQGKMLDDRNKRFFYHWQWLDAGKPHADYVIVDEIQDFTFDEIQDFVNATRKSYFFFGDTAQSIYGGIKKTISIKELSEKLGVSISFLNSNYRLPKPVARITQDYVGVGVSRYTESIYKSKEAALPHIVHVESEKEQAEAIIHLIEKKTMNSVGILVPNNNDVLRLMSLFNDRSFLCEFKYNSGINDKQNKDTLNFDTENPKLMTYHSAKGLQFETVIMPYCRGALTSDDQKALYVAMTRTYRFLYILYTETAIPAPLSSVPQRLYLETLE